MEPTRTIKTIDFVSIGIIVFSLWIMCIVPSKPHNDTTRPPTRTELIEKQFSGWDGSHNQLVREVKNQMNDPSSFEHIKTRYRDDGDRLYMIMKFHGANAFGGIVVNVVHAYVNTRTGEVLSMDYGL